MAEQKRIVAIHDISGFGKCSLTVALPILSAVGLEACAVPTAVLSTHTGGFEGYTYLDLTDTLDDFIAHWKKLNLQFDVVYSGYLGSEKQIEIVKEFFVDFDNGDLLKVVDPAMADHGKMYTGFSDDFALLMRELCAKADIIVPNITEAAMMSGNEYKTPPHSKEYIETLLSDLCEIGAKQVVLTGVSFEEGKLGVAFCTDASLKNFDYVFDEHLKGAYHGTGDVFSSVLIASYVNGKSLHESVRIAARFVGHSIRRMLSQDSGHTYGVEFEKVIPWLIQELDLYNEL